MSESSSTGSHMVVAPCNMEAGYTFVARSESGDDLRVTVPEGGVRQGQLFRSASPSSIVIPSIRSLTNLTDHAPLLPLSAKNKNGNNTNNNRLYSYPGRGVPGEWRDDLWDCFRVGVFHASVWNAMFCPLILVGQILTRQRLNLCGEPATNDAWKKSFRRMVIIVITFWSLSTITAPPPPVAADDTVEENGIFIQIPHELHPIRNFMYHLISWSFGLYTLFILTKLHFQIRQTHAIPNMYICQKDSTTMLEDCCVSCWCGCCVVAQMARHTADYEHTPAACCSRDGLLRLAGEDDDAEDDHEEVTGRDGGQQRPLSSSNSNSWDTFTGSMMIV